ncbi:structure-specific endonuclease subunit SLX4-like [Pomacea canaliculata]|uniref:structure-specific endonuclease subunit SLX4-like n=1 Tax=Pomacea canaliculata TaxID=400727 RepID=UPI000D72D23A|nr:structure-specific endonuclease subunit SLX4-like [Pomacea canaliculata]
MSGQPKYDQTEPPLAALEPSPTTYKPSLAAFEPDSYSMPDDGVWEGFDDVEMHSPDLEVIGSVLDSLENKDNAMDCLVRSGPVKMADTLLKSVMSSVKIVDSPVLKHHQNQLSRPDIEYNHYGALLDSSVRERCSSPENVCGLLPDLHTRMGGFMTDADVAAYDNSFLWSEENAPELIISKEILPAFQCSQKTVKSSHGLPPKTPSQRLKKGQHVLVPPSPFTPMPDYDRMTTPQLKAEVQKFGVRPLGKRKMKCLLKDIYEKTHQYETDSELDEADLVADLGTETNKPGTCSQPLHRLSNPDARPLQKASHRKTKSRPLKTKSTGKRRGVDGERHTLAETMETEEVAIVRHRHSSGQTAKSPMKRGVVPVAGERERALSECSRSPDKYSLSSSQAF